MKLVAISTVHDEGAAAVAKEALEAAGLHVEIKRVSPTAYVGPVALLEFEVRVPEAQLAEAEQALHRLSEEAAAAATRQWRSEVADAEATSPADSRPKPRLTNLPTWEILLGVVVLGVVFSLVAFFLYLHFWNFLGGIGS